MFVGEFKNVVKGKLESEDDLSAKMTLIKQGQTLFINVVVKDDIAIKPETTKNVISNRICLVQNKDVFFLPGECFSQNVELNSEITI